MKISFNIRKILSSESIKEGGRNPYVDWAMILIVTFIISLFFIVEGFFTYKKVINGEIKSNEAPIKANKEILNKENFEYIIDKFDTKQKTMNDIKSEFKSYKDPLK